MDFVKRNAELVRNNPLSWQKEHNAFLNDLYDFHKQAIKKLLSQPHGKEKIAELYGIKNMRVFEDLIY